jgi:hypothetical protein
MRLLLGIGRQAEGFLVDPSREETRNFRGRPCIGAYAIIFGVAMLVFAFRLKTKFSALAAKF